MQTFENLLLIGFFTYQSIVLIAITFKPFLILSFLPVAIYQEKEKKFYNYQMKKCFYVMKKVINFVILTLFKKKKIHTECSQDLPSSFLEELKFTTFHYK